MTVDSKAYNETAKKLNTFFTSTPLQSFIVQLEVALYNGIFSNPFRISKFSHQINIEVERHLYSAVKRLLR